MDTLRPLHRLSLLLPFFLIPLPGCASSRPTPSELAATLDPAERRDLLEDLGVWLLEARPSTRDPDAGGALIETRGWWGHFKPTETEGLDRAARDTLTWLAQGLDAPDANVLLAGTVVRAIGSLRAPWVRDLILSFDLDLPDVLLEVVATRVAPGLDPSPAADPRLKQRLLSLAERAPRVFAVAEGPVARLFDLLVPFDALLDRIRTAPPAHLGPLASPLVRHTPPIAALGGLVDPSLGAALERLRSARSASAPDDERRALARWHARFAVNDLGARFTARPADLSDLEVVSLLAALVSHPQPAEAIAALAPALPDRLRAFQDSALFLDALAALRHAPLVEALLAGVTDARQRADLLLLSASAHAIAAPSEVSHALAGFDVAPGLASPEVVELHLCAVADRLDGSDVSHAAARYVSALGGAAAHECPIDIVLRADAQNSEPAIQEALGQLSRVQPEMVGSRLLALAARDQARGPSFASHAARLLTAPAGRMGPEAAAAVAVLAHDWWATFDDATRAALLGRMEDAARSAADHVELLRLITVFQRGLVHSDDGTRRVFRTIDGWKVPQVPSSLAPPASPARSSEPGPSLVRLARIPPRPALPAVPERRFGEPQHAIIIPVGTPLPFAGAQGVPLIELVVAVDEAAVLAWWAPGEEGASLAASDLECRSPFGPWNLDAEGRATLGPLPEPQRVPAALDGPAFLDCKVRRSRKSFLFRAHLALPTGGRTLVGHGLNGLARQGAGSKGQPGAAGRPGVSASNLEARGGNGGAGSSGGPGDRGYDAGKGYHGDRFCLAVEPLSCTTDLKSHFLVRVVRVQQTDAGAQEPVHSGTRIDGDDLILLGPTDRLVIEARGGVGGAGTSGGRGGDGGKGGAGGRGGPGRRGPPGQQGYPGRNCNFAGCDCNGGDGFMGGTGLPGGPAAPVAVAVTVAAAA